MRERLIVSIAQFRPEKNHKLQLQSFALYLKTKRVSARPTELVLIGSCRNAADEKRVDELRQICAQLGYALIDSRISQLRSHFDSITSNVRFQTNVSNQELRGWLSRAACGLHTMWCEHFGIGIVELMVTRMMFCSVTWLTCCSVICRQRG